MQSALKDAVEKRRPDGFQSLHLSDRGCQYTSDADQWTLRTLAITCSMSGTSNCYDNAVTERFFWSLKHEWTNHSTDVDLEATSESEFAYTELFYSQPRLHQTLAWLSPAEFESSFYNDMAAAAHSLTANATQIAV